MDEWKRHGIMAERYKESYPPGTRIMLLDMNDPYAPVPSGTKGTVVHVDDAAQIHMKWDNGRTLAIIPGEDSFRRLTDEELAEEQMAKLPHTNGEITAFCTDIGCSFMGYPTANRWNGWECPLFPKSSADEIMQYYTNDYSRMKYDEETDSYIAQCPDYDCPSKYEGQDYVVNGKIEHLYAIGSHEWCWEQAEQEENQNMDEDNAPVM